MLTHFPWIETRNPHIWYVLARRGGAVVGGLTVLERTCGKGVFGVVGLVCVDASMRGQKIASHLTQTAIEQAQSRHCGALTLWTGQPHIYASQGFVVHDSSAYGWVTRATESFGTPGTPTDIRKISGIGTRKGGSGVPPFALGTEQIECVLSHTTVTLANDANGAIVAEWHGEDVEVEALFRAALPARFRLNCRQDDSLVALMATSGWTTALQPSNLQAWRVFDAAATAGDWDEASCLRLLDRI